jgi:hypothetical protein
MHTTNFTAARARQALLPLACCLIAGEAQASSPTAAITIHDSANDSTSLSLSSLLSTTSDGSVLLTDYADGTNLNALAGIATGNLIASTFNGQAAVTWTSADSLSSVIFTATGKGDPEMSYGFYVKNSTSLTQTYTITYGEDIDPAFSGSYSLNTTLGGSLSNTDGSATIAPTGSKVQALQVFDGVNYVNAGVDIGTAFTNNANGTATYGTYSASTSGTVNQPWTSWRFVSQFTLTGKGDVFTASGTASLVPEADSRATLLAGLGVCGLLLSRARRRR